MTATLERLVVPIEWKASTDDDQTLEGYASTFGNVDLGGDVVVKGAFAKTIANIKANGIPLLADHVPSVNSVLGTIFDAVEDGKGLKIKARFSSAQSAQDARTKLVEGHVNRMSIGYETIKHSFSDKNGQRVRLLEEIKLWETSVVVFPMNPDAVISRVKSIIATTDLPEVDYASLLRDAKAAREQATERAGDDGKASTQPEGKATANETREALDTALREHFKSTRQYAWLRDYDEAKVWYEVHGGGVAAGIFQRDYTIDDQASVEFGETEVKVRMVVQYVPVNDDGEADDSKATTLRVEAKTSEGDESSASGDEPEAEAAAPAASEDDESSALTDEVKGWDRWRSAAILNDRPTGMADPATRARLEATLGLVEQAIEAN